MKKVLLGTAAVCGLAVAATPAHAELDLNLGGFMKGYAFYTNQDDDGGAAVADSRELDIIRQTEIHATGETTLDNGLTVGFHTEMEADGNSGAGGDGFEVEESYAYFSGGWGRVNFGAEDGASYLLQVAAPSADSNIDGIRQYVNPVNYTTTQTVIAGVSGLSALDESGARGGFDYDQDVTGKDDKVTYLSPILNGFQLGMSYTPDVADAADEDALNTDDVQGAAGEAYEVSGRYEGNFNDVGFTLGAGYTHVDQEAPDTAIIVGDDTDDRTAWNVGLDLDIGPFGIGAAYLEDDNGDIATTAGAGPTVLDDEEIIVVGVDYTTGPFKLGASYMDVENTGGLVGNVAGSTQGVDSDRWTGGVVYTYGPGMTFRGSISHVEHENVANVTNGSTVDATSVLLGTQINF